MRHSRTGVRNDPGQYDRLAGEWWKPRGAFARHGFRIRVRGLRLSVRDYVGFLLGRRDSVRLRPTRSLASVYQGVGRKAS